jgi:hypothetical protein
LESEYPEEVLELIREEMSNIKITVEEIKRVSKVNIANFILHFNDIVTVTEDIQDDIISYEKIEENILNIYKNLNEKTANDIVKKIDLTNEAVYLIENFPKV